MSSFTLTSQRMLHEFHLMACVRRMGQGGCAPADAPVSMLYAADTTAWRDLVEQILIEAAGLFVGRLGPGGCAVADA